MATLTRPRIHVTGTRLEAELRARLRAHGSAPVAVDEATAFIEAHGTGLGCGSLESEDVAAVDALIRAHSGDVEHASAADWPPAWDEDRYGPTESDAAWWAVESSRAQAGRELDDLEHRAAESTAADALGQGLVPADLRPVRRTGGITDTAKAVRGYV